jgi:hypothetical protein
MPNSESMMAERRRVQLPELLADELELINPLTSSQ